MQDAWLQQRENFRQKILVGITKSMDGFCVPEIPNRLSAQKGVSVKERHLISNRHAELVSASVDVTPQKLGGSNHKCPSFTAQKPMIFLSRLSPVKERLPPATFMEAAGSVL